MLVSGVQQSDSVIHIHVSILFQIYHRSFPTVVKVLSPTLAFSAWESGNRRRSPQRIWLWRQAGFDCRNYTGLGKTETPPLEDMHKDLWAPGPRGEKQWPNKKLGQIYLLVLEGLLQRHRVAVAHCGDKNTDSSSSGKYSLAWVLLEATIIPIQWPVSSNAGKPQAKQPTGREHSFTNQQTSGLKSYWAQPCP